jgi:NAD(P)-dependent dehydrogenase (short-subunit alcohol dehydrogenase family)
MNIPPSELDPSRQVHAETIGRAPGRGRLHGRRIVIVGAGQRRTVDADPPIGNGRAMAVLFAREGAAVACIDASHEAVDATCAQIASAGGRAYAEVADVRDPNAIAPSLERCVAQLGGFDGLVCNVGISYGLPLAKLTAESWDHEYAVNVRAHMLYAQKALDVLDAGGAIVLISSLASQRAAGGNPAYESSKAAQLALARAIAKAGEPRGIRCNAVAPGLIDTPMGRDATRRRPNRAAAVPFGRQGTAWEVAYAALFLISNEASYVNGEYLIVDGGLGVGIARS